MFKIEKLPQGSRTILRLIGRIRLEHLEELKAQLRDDGPRIKLDLDEVTLVDVDVVRLLRACEMDGIQLVNCSPYVREWIDREQECDYLDDVAGIPHHETKRRRR